LQSSHFHLHYIAPPALQSLSFAAPRRVDAPMHETYTLGYERAAMAFVGRRRLDPNGAFFLPYLAGGMPDRLLWDARMAASVAKQGTDAAHRAPLPIHEVFYPRIFRSALVPLARALAWCDDRIR